jgi:hypothetical protein
MEPYRHSSAKSLEECGCLQTLLGGGTRLASVMALVAKSYFCTLNSLIYAGRRIGLPSSLMLFLDDAVIACCGLYCCLIGHVRLTISPHDIGDQLSVSLAGDPVLPSFLKTLPPLDVKFIKTRILKIEQRDTARVSPHVVGTFQIPACQKPMLPSRWRWEDEFPVKLSHKRNIREDKICTWGIRKCHWWLCDGCRPMNPLLGGSSNVNHLP